LIDGRKIANEPFKEEEIMTMCASIAFALLKINSMDGEHRNMKPNKILV
jgi:hypothetical protein